VTLHDLHVNFDFGFVLGFPDPRGDDGQTVMLREFSVCPVDLGFVAVRAGHTGFQVVWHDHFWATAKELEGATVRAEPILEVLRVRDFSVGVIAGTERGHEHLRLVDLPGGAVGDGHG
jgi:hypothetical protein